MAELRWGILSTAHIGTAKVIPAIQAAPRCEVTAIASRSAQRAHDTATLLGIPKALDSYEALLADADVDAVYIPLPNHLHAAWTVAAARAGKHVLCEKPLALSETEAQRMVEACDAEGVVLMEAFMYRLHPSWVAVRDLVATGRIGKLRAVEVWFSYFNDDPTNIRNLFDAGGGALWDIGCYGVNVARWLFGAEPGRIEAAIVRDPVDRTDVLTTALLEFGDGVASITCSTRVEPDQRVHVYGSAGRITVPIPFNIPPDLPTEVHLTHGGDPPVHPRSETFRFDPANQYSIEAEGFATAVLDGVPVPIPPTDAVANVAAIARIFEAAASSRGG